MLEWSKCGAGFRKIQALNKVVSLNKKRFSSPAEALFKASLSSRGLAAATQGNHAGPCQSDQSHSRRFRHKDDVINVQNHRPVNVLARTAINLEGQRPNMIIRPGQGNRNVPPTVRAVYLPAHADVI